VIPEQLAPLVRDILDARLPDFDPWFYKYCGDLITPDAFEKYIRHKSDLLAFAGINPRGARVLDAGAGFGLTLVVLASLGAKRAQGIEFHEPMVQTTNAYLPMLPDDLREHIGVDHGDVTAMPYPDRSFDAVLSVEAISHYRDVEAALAEIHRVLRPEGIVAISDGNNGLNPLTRRKTHAIWDAFELGSRQRRIHGHNLEHNYQADREQFIRTRFPSVPADRMARETFGMTFSEIEQACLSYEREYAFPGSIYDGSMVPTNPVDGQVIERLFNPYSLGRMLAQKGFDIKVNGYWGGAGGRRSLRLANTLLSHFSRLTIYSARGFLIAGRKLRDFPQA
jgi:SAM-dependent methyltransferase